MTRWNVMLIALSQLITSKKVEWLSLFVCLFALLANIYEKQPNPKDYLCEHGYDVIQLCRQLLVGGVSLTTTIAKQKPLDWPYLLISDKDLMEEFFQGISLKTGGQLLKAKDVRQLSEVKGKLRFRSSSTGLSSLAIFCHHYCDCQSLEFSQSVTMK